MCIGGVARMGVRVKDVEITKGAKRCRRCAVTPSVEVRPEKMKGGLRFLDEG